MGFWVVDIILELMGDIVMSGEMMYLVVEWVWKEISCVMMECFF